MDEIWKDIVDYEGLYQASNFGRVRSLDRTIIRNGYQTTIKGKILAIKHSKAKYCSVCLCKEGIAKYHLLHRKVWEAFNGRIPSGMEINHKDCNPLNCKLDNLEICTPSYNRKYGNREQRIREKRLIKVYQYEGGELVGIWDSAVTASKFLGLCRRHICNCCNGKRKVCGGYQWSYTKKAG